MSSAASSHPVSSSRTTRPPALDKPNTGLNQRFPSTPRLAMLQPEVRDGAAFSRIPCTSRKEFELTQVRVKIQPRWFPARLMQLRDSLTAHEASSILDKSGCTRRLKD